MTAPTRELHRPVHPVRFVTAASLFDGHDAAINIMRRLLQSQGVEVIHLGHNRSVEEIVTAAVQEDVQGVAVSSYQGGHLEYFGYLLRRLAERGASSVRVYGGGGGVITAEEVATLQRAGVARIFRPEDGQHLGLAAMVNVMVRECDRPPAPAGPGSIEELAVGDDGTLARVLTAIELGAIEAPALARLRAAAAARHVPSLGITGTGGSGKSSLTDELVRRVRLDTEDKLRVTVLAVDPTRRKGGGALLGDRIRMNAIDGDRVYFRSVATRGSGQEVPDHVADMIAACRAAGADLVIVETPGIGQGDAAIVPLVDVSLYVMTPEFGAASQLEKIDMLDFADVVAINKFDRRGADDALRDVRRVLARRDDRSGPSADLPVFGTIAARFNDDGVTALYQHLRDELARHGLAPVAGALPRVEGRTSSAAAAIIPARRIRYLSEVADAIRSYHDTTAAQVRAARRCEQLAATAALLDEAGEATAAIDAVARLRDRAGAELSEDSRSLLGSWSQMVAAVRAGDGGADGDGADGDGADGAGAGGSDLVRVSLSGTPVPRVAVPRFEEAGERLRWLRDEHLPGHFPFTSGVFPFKRRDEDPARMFAGEGDPARTNRRFHLLSEGQPATRLSTAFDSVTLYGHDPGDAPDVYGKVGTSGVSVATLDDVKDLYAGFDLCDPTTSVSMTINGPAPTILAMFLNTAIDQQLEVFERTQGRTPSDDEAALVRERTLHAVRGTVQADILKEDQGQNTCIFSTEFSLGVMADIQEYFVRHQMGNFYSVSISGYHIAEAGANPITQLAFTLANGFTYVESYLARGMAVDDFAANLSFFFSNGMDPEYTVIGRVARRIWAIAMRDRYGAAERSQKLKYHVQTSGRSLHAQEMAFNDIRTTLQALCAIYDNANSLHTNAFDEAVTTPTADSVRRALAIQLVINKEWGLAMNENPLQGSFIVEELTALVEEAVLAELDRISDRGGVLGAMETGYQRGRIQDDSMTYEHAKHDGSLPIVGVNTFTAVASSTPAAPIELARATEDEKRGQIRRLADFHARHAPECPGALTRLRATVLEGGNVFDELMETVRHASLGQITEALFEVGGVYRRSM